MSLPKLEQYLREHDVPFSVMEHAPAYTAREVAANAHIPGQEVAKSVLVKLDGRLAMVVLPASERVELGRLRALTGADEVSLASEPEFRERFAECEVGAMPPFGNLYGLEVFVAESLAEDDEIAFSCGSHHEVMRMRFADFERLVEPKVARVSH